ncbi:MAG: cysteine desulfurase family protein [Thermoanaerobaculia bacterium]
MEVYLDFENGCPLPQEVLEEMLPYFNEKGFGHSALTHKRGWEAYGIIEENTKEIAELLGTESNKIYFAHDAVEGANLAILGLEPKDKRNKILISKIEPLHFQYPVEEMKKRGFEVIKVPVDREGFLDEELLFKNIDENTHLFIFSWINHEIGTVQNFEEICKKVKEKYPTIYILSDLSDTTGRIPFKINDLPIDMAIFSGYKIYGPKGIGILYKKSEVKLNPLIYGPFSTQPLWPGEENIPAIVGLKKALKILIENYRENQLKIKKYQEKLMKGLLQIPHTFLNGSKEKRAFDNVNISFLGCEGEAMTVELSDMGIYISSGSACTRRILQPSHVLLALGKKYEEAHGSLLMKLWPYHKEEEIEYVIDTFPKAVERIRKISGFKGGL